MNASILRQRLKELTDESFEGLCYQILRSRHPELNVTKIEGAGGDAGVDIYAGNLGERPIIWQCKYFRNGVKQAQKNQVLKSLKTVLEHYTPRIWILCIPVDLSGTAQIWFHKIKRDFSNTVEVKCFPAAEIVPELLRRPSILEQFFPNAFMVASRVRSVIAGNSELLDADLAQKAVESVVEQQRRYSEGDARFDYIFSFPGSSHPGEIPPSNRAFLSYFDGEKRVDVIPRDFEALKLNPPRAKLEVKERTALEKLRRAIEKGTRETFGPHELRILSLPLAEVLSMPLERIREIEIGPKPSPQRMAYRVIAESGDHKEQYPFLEFAITRPGTEEVELRSLGPAALQFSIVLTKGPISQFALERDFVGKKLEDVKKAILFEKVLREGGTVSIVDLRSDREIGGSVSKSVPRYDVEDFDFLDFIGRLQTIEKRFGISILYPSNVTEEDWQTMNMLYGLATVGVSEYNVEEIRATLLRAEYPSLALEKFGNEFGVRLDSKEGQPLYLFGNRLALGPTRFEIEKVVPKDRDDLNARYRAAKPGEGIEVVFSANSPGKFFLQGIGANVTNTG